jgi:hypothetical protein
MDVNSEYHRGDDSMSTEDIELMAHLMRRAGFGADRDELEARVAKGYEATVEELLNPTGQRADRQHFLLYHPGFKRPIASPGMGSSAWLYDMMHTELPLEEKMVPFWHQPPRRCLRVIPLGQDDRGA